MYNRGFCRVRLLNDARQIPPQSTPVAIATKFKTKLAITRLVYEISRRSLCPTRSILGRAIE